MTLPEQNSTFPSTFHAKVNAGFYPLQNYWRVGRKVGRTIYAQIGSEPSDDDPLIGVMDTIAIARAAVEGHNRLMGAKAGMNV